MATGTINQRVGTLYRTTPYSGTTTSGANITSISLPKGQYVLFSEGFVSNSAGTGAYVTDGTQGCYMDSKAGNNRVLTLTSTATVYLRPVSSQSTTWTNYSIVFIKIS